MAHRRRQTYDADGMQVFISYRRDDAAGYAARIAEHLIARYGRDAVFIDVEAIGAGEDFVEAIERAMWDADVVLVVIGPGWVGAAGPDGGLRLDDPRDFVRLEIEAALRRGVRTIPLLVGGASMPSPGELPEPLVPLSRLNGVALDDPTFDADLGAILDALEDRRVPDASTVHLPPQPTPFVGRGEEIDDIGRSLAGGDARLLTLVGPGGAGKTRLSIEVAAGLVEHYPDGIWFVGLSSLQDPELIASTIATTLGLHEGFGSSLEETLQRFLRGRRVLLVIDNVEHLLPGAATVLSDVLAGAPDVQMMVSSREPLGLRSERVYPVRELPVADAVVLFRERARAAAPSFDADERAASSIEAICSRLEGLPLAIELAAARIKVLSPTELFERLNERLPLLTGGGRDAPERQRTMRAAIAWSYDLLDEDERRLFARLGVFRGGWTLEAAEEVCDAELDALASLVDKSLLRTEERPPGATRYLSLETIREFAAELLRAEGGWEPISMRHAEYFRSQAELAYADLRGPHPATWIDRVEPELANLRAAVRSSLDQGRAGFALRLMAALMTSLQPCGHVQEARAAGLDEVLARSGDVRTPERGQVLAAAGVLHLFLGELASSRSLLEEAVELAREVGDRRTLALAMGRLGWARAAQGLHDEHTFALGEEAVGEARALGDPWLLAETLNALSCAYAERGYSPRAVTAGEESLGLRRSIADLPGVADCLLNLGWLAVLDEKYPAAVGYLEEALELARMLSMRAYLIIAQGNLALARLLNEEPEPAERLLRETLRLCLEMGDRRTGQEALIGLAGAAAQTRRWDRAAWLAGAASTQLVELDIAAGLAPRIEERYLPAARRALGDEPYEDAYERGRRASFEDAVAYAIG